MMMIMMAGNHAVINTTVISAGHRDQQHRDQRRTP
jgi:hypothetical protein